MLDKKFKVPMKAEIFVYNIYQNNGPVLKIESMADYQTWTFKNKIGRFHNT